jgi:N-acyl-L-homoserine lactone synthetase
MNLQNPNPMVTLTPITEPAKLEEYFRFRFRIYSESRQAGFLNGGSDGLDVDAFDARALHFGWYMNDALVGCVRFVQPDENADALPMLSYMREGRPRAAVKRYITERRRRNECMVEASRFCLAPEHRGLSTAKEFVLAMVRTMAPQGFEHGVFDSDDTHVPFYRRCGFEPLEGAMGFRQAINERTLTCLTYDYDRISRKQGWDRRVPGLNRPCGVRNAA